MSLEKTLGSSADVFVELLEDYDHQTTAAPAGRGWRFALHQSRSSCRVGLNRSSPARNGEPVGEHFDIGYSTRLDGLFGGRGVRKAS
jgi:hypothetical protein